MHKFFKYCLRQPSCFIGLFIVFMVICSAVLAPMISPMDPNGMSLVERLIPSLESSSRGMHILGTDSLGRDVLSRIIYGARISLMVGLISAFISIMIGVTLGLISGYFGGVVDAVIMRFADIQLAFPFILLALTVMATIGGGTEPLIFVLGIGHWMTYARVVRGEVLSLKNTEFVEAARASGLKNVKIIIKHILPNIVAPTIVLISFNVASNILNEASLSFLGIGVDVGTPSWGSLMAEGREYISTAWWVTTYSGLATMLTVLGINLLGDGVRDYLDPKLKK